MHYEVAFVDEHKITQFAVEITFHHSSVHMYICPRKLKSFCWSKSVNADADNTILKVCATPFLECMPSLGVRATPF